MVSTVIATRLASSPMRKLGLVTAWKCCPTKKFYNLECSPESSHHSPRQPRLLVSLPGVFKFVNHFKVGHTVVEPGEERFCFRINHRMIEVFAAEFPDRFHRIPEGKHNKFRAPLHGMAQQICTAMTLDLLQLGEDSAGCMLNVLVGLLRARLPFPHAQDHAVSSPFVFSGLTGW